MLEAFKVVKKVEAVNKAGFGVLKFKRLGDQTDLKILTHSDASHLTMDDIERPERNTNY